MINVHLLLTPEMCNQLAWNQREAYLMQDELNDRALQEAQGEVRWGINYLNRQLDAMGVRKFNEQENKYIAYLDNMLDILEA